VERKEGSYRAAGQTVRVVDLPGVYSLSPAAGSESVDEKLARDYIHGGEAQVIVDIVDAANLERNLYLTAQLVESRRPMVLALNMMDRARARGLEIDAALLARRLGCPVVPMVAARGAGLEQLKAAVGQAAAAARAPTAAIGYAPGLEQALAELTPLLASAAAARHVDGRWLALRALEGDAPGAGAGAELAEQALARRAAAAAAALGDDPDILIADGRFAFANELAAAVARQAGRVRRGASDAIDRIVLNRWLGPVIFLALMYLMFMFTINLGGAFVDFFELTAGLIFVDGLGALLAAAGSPRWLMVLLADGFGGGLQVVATFVPIIGFLYLFLSLLDDSGYLARAAFLMDRLMRVVGLPGKSVVPLIVGFGCNVPAIMASRTLARERDRVLTVVMTPFMSCGARLTVYALFATAFFPVGGQNVVFALYLIGIGAAVATGLMLKHTLLKGETVPFVMELPPYCRPRARDVLLHAWVRLKGFLFGAGKVIVLVVVVLNFLNSLGSDGSFGNEDSEKSALSAVGRALVPAFEPLGIRRDNWPATVGLFTGVFAKEAVVGTLDALYAGLARDPAAEEDDAGGAGAFDFRAGVGGVVSRQVHVMHAFVIDRPVNGPVAINRRVTGDCAGSVDGCPATQHRDATYPQRPRHVRFPP